jgi:hypothetical protein
MALQTRAYAEDLSIAFFARCVLAKLRNLPCKNSPQRAVVLVGEVDLVPLGSTLFFTK